MRGGRCRILHLAARDATVRIFASCFFYRPTERPQTTRTFSISRTPRILRNNQHSQYTQEPWLPRPNLEKAATPRNRRRPSRTGKSKKSFNGKVRSTFPFKLREKLGFRRNMWECTHFIFPVAVDQARFLCLFSVVAYFSTFAPPLE